MISVMPALYRARLTARARHLARDQAAKCGSSATNRPLASFGPRHRRARPSMLSTKARAEASQVWLAANSTQACGGICQRARQAARRSSLEHADRRVADHVAGPGHRKRRDRQAARQRLQQHQAEGVGLAREHEDVGGGIDLRQFLAVPRAEKHRFRIVSLQRRARRPVADDHLGAGQIEIEEGLEILLDRDAADTEKDRRAAGRDRSRADGTARCRRRAATAPHCESRARAIRAASAGVAAITAWLGPWNQRSAAPDPGFRHRRARRDIFGKAGVEARGERQPVLAAIAPHQQADRPFGRDVDAVGLRLLDQSRDLRRPRQRQPQVADSSASQRCGTIAA